MQDEKGVQLALLFQGMRQQVLIHSLDHPVGRENVKVKGDSGVMNVL